MNEQLKKEVEALLSQGNNEQQIKAAMTEKGYTIKDIEEAIKSPVSKPKNNNRIWLIAAIAFLILFVIIVYSLINSQPKLTKFSDNPNDWVIDNKDGSKEVDINLISRGKSFIDDQGQQYRTPEIKTMFNNYGYYQGNYFEKDYGLMSINSNMTPNDGVIECFTVFNIVNNSPVFYLFVDEDWKQKVTPTKIFYGFEHTKSKDFEFKEVSKGVYMDMIVDDKENYDEKYQLHLGSIVMGDATLEKIESNNNNLTMIVIK